MIEDGRLNLGSENRSNHLADIPIDPTVRILTNLTLKLERV
ncbi:hypothetical protein M595_3497 [Lyngbya aestuarii BL J]|uniref:Uncharacterized protein n=1 Tax=Lyngbya aestuarii BL J TaxID=1348334 RepID=U7QJC7_9CYAN|nr:hypothetical protein M595_3497 [Lyngbya aestuarii BL J]